MGDVIKFPTGMPLPSSGEKVDVKSETHARSEIVNQCLGGEALVDFANEERLRARVAQYVPKLRQVSDQLDRD